MQIKNWGTILIAQLALFLTIFSKQTFASNLCATTCKEAGSSATFKENSPIFSKNRQINKKQVEVLRDYLAQFNSPLAQNADTFIATAQIYNLDWRILPAISGVESTFGKRTAYKTYNAWGWGGGHIQFPTWNAGIETVGKALRENYMDKWGAITIEQIAPIYAPPSKTWAKKVRYFMRDISRFEKKRSYLAINSTF